MVRTITCPLCGGSGVLRDAVSGWDVGEPPPLCDRCHGDGNVRVADFPDEDIAIARDDRDIMGPPARAERDARADDEAAGERPPR